MTIPKDGQTVHLMTWRDAWRVRRDMRRTEGRNVAELALYTTDDLRRLYQATNDAPIRLRDGIVSRAQLVAVIRLRILWARFNYALLLAVSIASAAFALFAWRAPVPTPTAATSLAAIPGPQHAALSATTLPWIQALLLPGIGAVLTGVGIWVAVQQMHLARLKTQHDLFDRRFAIYLATLDLFGSISATGRVLPTNRDQFQQERLKADFILSSGLASYLRDEVWDHMMRLEDASRRVKRDGADLEKALDAEGVETTWFHEELPRLRLRFRQEMNLLR